MVTTGLKGCVADHAENIADLALGMQKAFGEFRRDNNVDLKLRIGVHSGAFIAGVIGKQKILIRPVGKHCKRCQQNGI